MVTVDYDRLLKTFVDLCSVNTFHGQEERAEAIVRPRLEACGVHFTKDAIGNLIGVWPGRGRDGRWIMLNAHTDTVRPTEGMTPRITSDGVASDGSSVLGADDKAGVAAIVEAVCALHASGASHGPVELVFTVGEDVGHIGSRAFDPARLQSRMAYVFDAGGHVGTVVMRAPGQRRLTAKFAGKAAHAGLEPELGRSAIQMLARAIDRMALGRLDAETTANVGVISGGQAYNIVAPSAELRVETRSLSAAKLEASVAALKRAMQTAASDLGGTVEIDDLATYFPYELSETYPAVQLADTALKAAGLAPRHVSTGGGSDAHEFIAKGLPSVCLGVGYVDVHSVKEFMPHAELRRIADVAIQLILHA